MPPKRKCDDRGGNASKKEKIGQTYREVYTERYPCIKPTSKPDFVRCEVCLCDFNISHGGFNDVQRHCEGSRHKSRGSSQTASVPKISNFFSTDSGLSVMRAETLFTSFLVEHSLPLATADHAGKLFRKMFPDSKIAKDYSCGRTKTGFVVKTLADDAVTQASKHMKGGPFILGTDGSQEGGDKLFPIVIR